MIITETIIFNDTEYLHTYSSEGYPIERDGVVYGDAIDPIDSNRTYVEVIEEKIEEAVELENNIPEEVEEGTKENPIIAASGLTYYKDKYYYDETDNNIYLCINDDNKENGIELYYMPHDLIGAYFIK